MEELISPINFLIKDARDKPDPPPKRIFEKTVHPEESQIAALKKDMEQLKEGSIKLQNAREKLVGLEKKLAVKQRAEEEEIEKILAAEKKAEEDRLRRLGLIE